MPNKDRAFQTSLRKNGERFEFYFVSEIGRNLIIGHEDEVGNDVYDEVKHLQSLGWTY